jgi:hypothetical protein
MRYKATKRIFFHNSGINQQPTKSTIKTLYTFQTTKSLKKFWIIPAAQRFFPKIIFLKNGALVAEMRVAAKTVRFGSYLESSSDVSGPKTVRFGSVNGRYQKCDGRDFIPVSFHSGSKFSKKKT